MNQTTTCIFTRLHGSNLHERKDERAINCIKESIFKYVSKWMDCIEEWEGVRGNQIDHITDGRTFTVHSGTRLCRSYSIRYEERIWELVSKLLLPKSEPKEQLGLILKYWKAERKHDILLISLPIPTSSSRNERELGKSLIRFHHIT